MQPVLDKCRNLIWCGAHDHCLYALDYVKQCCSYKISCGGSIYGSPSIDLVRNIIYVASTSGCVFGISIKALICSRNGSVFSLDVEGGEILWEYKVSDPITATAYVDEHSRLETEPSDLRDRLACVCSSSGRIHVLRINSNAKQAKLCDGGIPQCQMVREYAVIDVPGDIFSSPVMIGGRIFVGCRDDHVHCISLVT